MQRQLTGLHLQAGDAAEEVDQILGILGQTVKQRRQPGKAAGMAIIFKLTAQRSTRNQERE